MRGGLLKHRIDILTPIITKNEFGEDATSINLKYSTRARIVPTSGNRTNQNGDIFYEYSKTIQVRHYVPIDDFDIIRLDDKLYRILNIEANNEQMMKTINIQLKND